jgi:NitT/TauT family transport system permease protein
MSVTSSIVVSSDRSAAFAVRRVSAFAGAAARHTAACATLLLAWELVPRLGLVDPVFLPPFSAVVVAWWNLLCSGALESNTAASLSRAFSGLGLAIIITIPLGLLIGANRRIAQVLNPLLEVFRNTAPLALLPVFTLILGIGEASKVTMILYAASWPILLSTITGMRSVDPLLIKAARSMGLRPVTLFRKVILPASVQTLFTGVRLAAATSLLVLIATELVGARAGLGYMVSAAQYNFQIPEMYAGIITLSLIGLLLNLLLRRIEQWLLRWEKA